MTVKLDEFLAHFGIKGQKWGVRRSDAQLSSVSADSADAVRAQATQSAIRAKGSLSAVSDADLNHLVNRINTEKRYADINPSAFEKGHKQIKTLLDVGQTMNAAIKFANSPAGHLLATSLGLSKSAGRHAKPISELIKATGGKKGKKASSALGKAAANSDALLLL